SLPHRRAGALVVGIQAVANGPAGAVRPAALLRSRARLARAGARRVAADAVRAVEALAVAPGKTALCGGAGRARSSAAIDVRLAAVLDAVAARRGLADVGRGRANQARAVRADQTVAACGARRARSTAAVDVRLGRILNAVRAGGDSAD